MRGGLAEQMRMRETQHRARIVNGATVHAVVTAHVRVGEELHEVAEHVGELAGEGLHAIDARLRRAELMREMQPSHHQWSAVVEHDVGGLRVDPDVEFGGRGAVAEQPATHQRDSGDAMRDVGCEPQGESDVGERSGGHQPHTFVGAHRVDDVTHGVFAVHHTRGRGQIGAVESALTVHVRGVLRRGHERPNGALVNRNVEPEKILHHERVVRGGLDGCVARHGRDAEQVRVARRHHDGQRVVVAGIAVEDDRRLVAHREFPSSVVNQK